MHLRHGETVLKTIKRHKTPYIFKLLKIAVIALPLYFLIFYLGGKLDVGTEIVLGGFAVLSFFIGVIITLISVDYLLDKLVISNRRVVWVDWKSIFRRTEHEVEFTDVQDIETRETGILAKLHWFDYGLIEIETAASKTAIAFQDCPNPEGVKHFILTHMEKHHAGMHGKKEELPRHAEKSSDEEWSVN